ncbi:MAG TPA: glycosyltransferase [Rubrobacteraceae bacterium]|nr:glycosyltransferase [Rubrobacteraceae bacterium]
MLESVDVGRQSVDLYGTTAGIEAVEHLRTLADPLRGLRVLHLNATPYGGGVAEILRSEIPLLRDLGLAADWKIVTGDKDFFTVTKTMHNALQGSPRSLTEHEKEVYLTYSTRNAQLLEEEYDLIIAHDPQPLAIPQFHGRGAARWIWRCHIDTSEPHPGLWDFLRPYLDDYDAAVFTLEDFVPPDFPVGRIEVIPPAIDPESPKNIELDRSIASRILGWLGVDTDLPLVTQVSRFDSWKDQPGVISAYRLVKEEIPDLRLALVGSMALDDPEGWEIYREIKEAAREDPDIDIFTNLTGVGNVEVNAFQHFSDVCVQKSIREGFGLVVSETLWKGTPMVAGRAGGIPLQMQDGVGGFLVDSVEECAEKVLRLLKNPEEGAELAAAGRERVRERFLLTRLISDELALYSSVLESHTTQEAVREPAEDTA